MHQRGLWSAAELVRPRIAANLPYCLSHMQDPPGAAGEKASMGITGEGAVAVQKA